MLQYQDDLYRPQVVNNKQPSDSRHSEKVSNTISTVTTFSSISSSITSHASRGDNVSRSRNLLLEEGAIKLSTPSQNQYLSSISLVPEKDVGHHQEINLKQLAHSVCAFQNGQITPSKKAFQERGLHEFLKKFLKFRWKDSLKQPFFLCFGLDPASRVFTKLMQLLISLLRKHTSDISKQHFDNGILNGEIGIGKGQFNLSVTRYRLLINIEKSVLQPTQKIELLGIENDSEGMTLKLPQGKKWSDCMPVLKPFGDVFSYHKGVDPTHRVPVFHSHCNSPSISSALCNAEGTDLEVIS